LTVREIDVREIRFIWQGINGKIDMTCKRGAISQEGQFNSILLS
jgi:hypothetical protein